MLQSFLGIFFGIYFFFFWFYFFNFLILIYYSILFQNQFININIQNYMQLSRIDSSIKLISDVLLIFTNTSEREGDVNIKKRLKTSRKIFFLLFEKARALNLLVYLWLSSTDCSVSTPAGKGWKEKKAELWQRSLCMVGVIFTLSE